MEAKRNKTKILLIDDEIEIRDLLDRLLSKRGYEVFLASNGREALKMLEKSFELILLDQLMPELSGLRTFAEMKKKKNFNTPVIMLTAHESTHLAVSFMKEGGTDFIVKPIDGDILDLQIRRALEKNELIRKLHEAEVSQIAALKINQLKDDLLKSMNHELRTPLDQIVGSTHLLAMEVPQELSKHLNFIQQGVKMLTLLAENISHIIPLLAGSVEPNLQPLALSKIVFDLERAIEPTVKEKGLSCAISFSEDLPLVKVDRELLVRTIRHLLDNALKFTDTGSITANAKLEGDRVVIVVKDTGIGIPQNRLKNIFERFSKVDKSGQRLGAGLGLYICQKLIELMGGKIWVKSDLSKGSTFYVSLLKNHK